MTPLTEKDCQTCGACCAHFRVSFYWQEAEQRGLDPSILHQVTPWRVCMNGTESLPCRCSQLQGTLGQEVTCRVYESRPTPCRDLQPGDAKCLQARAAHGLYSETDFAEQAIPCANPAPPQK
jgi:uncharacterized protein